MSINLTNHCGLRYINYGNKEKEMINRKLGLESNALLKIYFPLLTLILISVPVSGFFLFSCHQTFTG